jgi:hypothetical protein
MRGVLARCGGAYVALPGFFCGDVSEGAGDARADVGPRAAAPGGLGRYEGLKHGHKSTIGRDRRS